MDALGLDTLAILACAAFVAGLIDAIAGGGGLLTVPALALAGFDPAVAIATNKVNATAGTLSATLSFARAGHIDFKAMWPLALACAGGAVAGALALSHAPRGLATLALPFILIAVAIYFAVSPTMSDEGARARMGAPLFLATFAPAIGFYDGIFGPGAGSFYTIGFVALLGFGVLRATAHTKLANFASNFGGLAAFALSGLIVWKVGILMAAAQFAGGRIGAGLALKNGARLIRPLLIVVSLAMALRLGLAPGHPIGAALRGVLGL